MRRRVFGQHPGIEIVARDRAGAYADGIRQGAPDAIQVSDRWHLLRNLGDAVRAVVDRHHDAIQRAAKQLNEFCAEPATRTVTLSPITPKMTTTQRRSQHAYGRRRSRYEEAARLRGAWASISAITATLGAERKTIRRWLRAGGALLWSRPPRISILKPYQAQLERRWAEGCHNASLLWRELAELDFAGRPGVVLQWAKARREKTPRVRRCEVISVPSGCSLAWLVMADPEVLPKAERSLALHLLDQVPPLADAITMAKRLNALLRRKTSGSLSAVLDAAARTPLKKYAATLRRDIGATKAALDLPWTTSPVEGRVNRPKMSKRTMHGRARFHLLRARVFYTA